MRRLLASLGLAVLLPLPALAQGAPSWLDLLSPDRIVQSLLQSGIVALRTQADIKYGGMTVDIRAGRVTLTDIQIWPMPPWEGGEDCEIMIDRLTLRTQSVDEPDRLRIKIQALGAGAPIYCFPEEQAAVLAMTGQSALEFARLTMDIRYHVPSGGADVAVHADARGIARAELSGAFSYLSLDGREDMEEPEPVMFLEHATLSLENEGIWGAFLTQAPPEFTQPNAGMMIEGMLGGMLAGANSDAADYADGDDPSALTAPQSAFLASIAEAWPAFLQNPERLVLETDIDGDVYLDFEAIEDNPREIFAALNPRVALAPAASGAILPTALIEAARGDTASLSRDDRLRLGLALATGQGAPRSVTGATALLSDLAEAGDGAAAMALSEALELRDTVVAYRWALVAGAARQDGAVARLDRLEGMLGMATVLDVQGRVSGDDQHDPAVLNSIAAIREEATQRLTGRGKARSYGIAAMWATIAAAAGDAEAADILDEIDDRMRMADEAGRASWASAEDAASRLAMDAWLSQDLSARFSQ